MDPSLNGQSAADKAMSRSGWRDLNSRPLDPQNNQGVRCGALQCDFERKTAMTMRPGGPI